METHAPASSTLWSLAHNAFTNVVTYAKMVSEAFADAQRMAREAERRFPYSYDW
jgi:hypothetical protein